MKVIWAPITQALLIVPQVRLDYETRINLEPVVKFNVRFEAFRGRQPIIAPLLKHSGFKEK